MGGTRMFARVHWQFCLAFVTVTLALLVCPRVVLAQATVDYENLASYEGAPVVHVMQPLNAADQPPVPPDAIDRTQPPRGSSESPRRSTASLSSARTRQRARQRLVRAPYLFGDTLAATTINIQNDQVVLSVPTSNGAGGSGLIQFKIADHNKALPDDRAYLLYNHFHNAVDVERSSTFGPPMRMARSLSINRYAFGIEKTFAGGLASFEARMPFAGSLDFATAPTFGGASDFFVDTDSIGNLAGILKVLLYSDGRRAICSGLGVNTPTGGDVFVRITEATTLTNIRFYNDAVHLLPFIGFVSAPDDDVFFHGFAQLDIPTHGNRVSIVDQGLTPFTGSFKLNSQAIFHLDAAMGQWHYRNSRGPVTGVASILELHYATALQSVDVINVPGGGATLSGRGNRFDAINLGMGLDVELNRRTNIRFGTVLPLRNDLDRFFDIEFLVQISRKH